MVNFMRLLPTVHYARIEDLENEDGSPEDKVWTFKEVLEHPGPLNKSHKDYKESLYHILLFWDYGSETYEPLDMVINDDPIMLASYACKNSLPNESGWRKLKTIA
jgi:hypothetical protein